MSKVETYQKEDSSVSVAFSEVLVALVALALATTEGVAEAGGWPARSSS